MALQETLLPIEGGISSKPRGLWKLYLSHALSTFGDRLWQFAIPVLMMMIWNDTLLPGAIFSFIVNIITAFLFPNIGAWVDRAPRKQLMFISVFGEALSMVLAALCFWVMLALMPGQDIQEAWESPPLTPLIVTCYIIITLCSTATEVFMQAGTIALEMNWPAKVVSKEADPEGTLLAEVNSTMTSIAQLSILLGPAAFGFAVDLAGGSTTPEKVRCCVLVILAWNMLCVPFEWFTLSSLYSDCPALSVLSEAKKKKDKSFFKDLLGGWKLFIAHPLSLPSMSGVLISFTVLNQNPVSTGWFVWVGIPLGVLGLLRGGAAVSGIIGGWTYRWIYRLCGSPARTALVGICTFAILLVPCGAAMAAFGSTKRGAWVLLAAITASRFALFWFKPAMTQLTQEHVQDDVRGAFQGTKNSLNKVFNVGIAAVAMALPSPQQFPVLVYLSVGAVGLAAAFFCIWMVRDKRTLLDATEDS